MGYMGLESVGLSDNASDLAYSVFGAMTKKLAKGLKEKGNEYNTPGFVNIALFVEQYLKPDKYYGNDELYEIIEKAKGMLEEQIETMDGEWPNENNRKYHLKSYKRMVKNMNKFLEKRMA